MDSGGYGNSLDCWGLVSTVSYIKHCHGLTDGKTADFVMTIPLGFVAERYGRRPVLTLNLVSRIWIILWAVVVGNFEDLLPTKAIIAAPMLSVLGGDCVFNSITYALASDLTEDRVLRYV